MSDAKITRKDALVYGGAAAGGLVVGGAAVAGLAAGVEARKLPQPLEGVEISAPIVDGDLPVEDPSADAWRQAQRVRVPLVPQQLVPPYLEQGHVDELLVRALHDGSDLALLLEWDDRDVDDLDGIRRYHDAVAVQLAATAGATLPPLTMGGPGAPVHILQWRATWQRDIDSGGKTGVEQIYPEVVHDVMPDDVLPPETAQLYWVGREAGNPLSLQNRVTPVEEIVAEGFGTVTHLTEQTARGHGNHEDGGWSVVVSFPLARAGAGSRMEPGSRWPAAFAVWLGSEENRGGRKHISDWQTIALEAQ